jgi:hypothetical protein
MLMNGVLPQREILLILCECKRLTMHGTVPRDFYAWFFTMGRQSAPPLTENWDILDSGNPYTNDIELCFIPECINQSSMERRERGKVY